MILLIYTTCQEYLESVKGKLVELPSESSSDVTWQHLAEAALLCTEGVVFPGFYWYLLVAMPLGSLGILGSISAVQRLVQSLCSEWSRTCRLQRASCYL